MAVLLQFNDVESITVEELMQATGEYHTQSMIIVVCQLCKTNQMFH